MTSFWFWLWKSATEKISTGIQFDFYFYLLPYNVAVTGHEIRVVLCTAMLCFLIRIFCLFCPNEPGNFPYPRTSRSSRLFLLLPLNPQNPKICCHSSGRDCLPSKRGISRVRQRAQNYLLAALLGDKSNCHYVSHKVHLVCYHQWGFLCQLSLKSHLLKRLRV